MPKLPIALCAAAMGVLLAAAALCADEVQVKKWPDDVPCDVVKKNVDGSYAQSKRLMMGTMSMPAQNYAADSPEARVWDKKCIK